MTESIYLLVHAAVNDAPNHLIQQEFHYVSSRVEPEAVYLLSLK